MPVFAFERFIPVLPPEGRFWIAPDANVIGQVELGEDVGIWFGAVLRGDNEPIVIGPRTNIQEGAMLHTDPGLTLSVGADCTIGHHAIIHGATIGDGTLIGMGATILNGARIGANCLVGAGALVTERKEFPDRSLIVGAPANAVRQLDDDAIAGIVASLKWRPGQAVVHCSGATEVSVLAPAEQAGARTGGFHPMQAFTDPQAALASLPGCTIAIEARDATLAEGLDALAVSLGCRAMRLPPGCRARYHASGGYASQFVNVLMREATDIWKSFGVSEADAVRARRVAHRRRKRGAVW
jgi:carbonic anhydrase/acetyltransferase-like protein (isoleucine patch superfamily)